MEVSRSYSLRGRLRLAFAMAFLPGLVLLVEAELTHRSELVEDQQVLLWQETVQHAHTIQNGMQAAAALARALTHLPSVRSLDAATCSPVLAALLPHFPQMGNLGVTDAQGNPVCSAMPLAGPANLADRAWFQRVLASGAAAIGDYQVSRATGRGVLNFAAPLHDGQALTGVTVVAVDLERLVGATAEAAHAADHMHILLDANGHVLWRAPDPEALTGTSVAGHPLFAQLGLADDSSARATHGFDGRYRLVSHATLQAGGQAFWLVLTRDHRQATADIDRALYRRVVLVGSATVLLAVLLWLGARRIVLQPLARLAEAAQRLGSGTLASSGDSLPRDELARLAEQVNRLSQEIGARETRTRAALAAQEASEARLRGAILQAPIPIIMYAEDGEVLLLSDTWCELSGYRSADIPTISAWVEQAYGVTGVDAGNGVRTGAGKLYQSPGPVDEGLFEIACRDGRRRTWHFHSAPLGQLQGGRRTAISMAIDVTEEQRQARALRESEERFRNMADHAPVMLWVTDGAGRCTYVNPRWCELTGQTLEHGLGAGWVEALHPDDRATVYAAFLDAQARQAEFQIRYRLLDHAGGIHDVIDSATPRLAADGKFLGYVGSVVDVTELLATEHALRDSERRYRELFEANPHPMWVYDLASLRFLAVNDAAVRHYGWSHEEFLGMSIADIRPPADVPALLEQVNTQSGSHDKTGLWRHVTRDGRELEVEIASHVLEFDGHRARVVLAHDVTARRRAEAALQALNRELEQRVAERTARLEEVNRELETFTYSVSHDLKAPLRAIDGYSRLLADDRAAELDGDGRVLLDNIRAGVEQMQRLIDDLLAYSRLERRTPRAVPLALRPLVEGLCSEFRQQIEQHAAEVTLDLPEVHVLADADGLAIALRNLLDNALKFAAAAAPPRIKIGARVAESSTILWIKDNGIGFDMRFHDRLFELFQRLERQEDYPGTGVGLALVHKALQRMHGRAWAESEPGHGATFYLELPNATRSE